MAGFSGIDLSDLPAPLLVEELDFEALVAEALADLAARSPALAEALSLRSEPLVKQAEAFAYRELLIRNRINQAARDGMVAFATGADLDQRAANLGVTRLPGESDGALRARAVLAPEGFSVAGPEGAYVFHALSADPTVADVAVTSPVPGQVRVVVLSDLEDGTGAPSAALVPIVAAALNDETVRPLTDQVVVVAAAPLPYAVDAELTLLPGPDANVVRAAAEAAVRAYAAERRRLGRPVTRAGLLAALMRPGVQNADLAAPIVDLEPALNAAGLLTAVSVVVGGVAQ